MDILEGFFFDTGLGIRSALLDSNMKRSWRWRILAKRGDEFEVVELFKLMETLEAVQGGVQEAKGLRPRGALRLSNGLAGFTLHLSRPR